MAYAYIRNAAMRWSAYAGLMINLAEILTALAEPTRLAALRLLDDGQEHCVCELMQRLGATQSRMSRHMGRLKGAGLVVDRRDAQWVRYRRNPALAPAHAAIIDAVMAALPDPASFQSLKKAA